MALFAKLLIAQRAFVEKLQSIVIILTDGGMIQSENFRERVSGFRIKSDGNAEFNNMRLRGHVDATSGTFSGRIEANEGHFRGELEAGPLRANTQPVTGNLITYTANTIVRNIMTSEFSRFGIQAGVQSVQLERPITGTYGGQAVSRIFIFDQGRAGVTDFSHITLTFANFQTQQFMSGSSLSSILSFRYRTEGWTVSINQIPTSDPKIPGVIWRDGTNLRVSVG